ncbi:hypothetical protein CGCS363_v012916 [Colletotrichum siamense]|nr:uncharacterized protein CGCS363_v012916 [Colletotrichum siamense]KAF5486738.1 hypothetical protein CGCS363_v012916 [Colletotrichum siamense]
MTLPPDPYLPAWWSNPFTLTVGVLRSNEYLLSSVVLAIAPRENSPPRRVLFAQPSLPPVTAIEPPRSVSPPLFCHSTQNSLNQRPTLPSNSVTMPAINSIVARDAVHQLAKRENWASQEAGVIVVFCIVFIVACGIAGLMISRCISRRKAAKAAA